MNHQITTKTTGDEWEQVMTCEFANATVAELVWDDASIGYRNHQECLLVDGKSKAELQREGKAIMARCKQAKQFSRNWDTNPDANKDALEALAQDWREQERAWLPTMRYFRTAKEKHNEALREWSKKHDERLNDIEHQIKELKRRLEALDQHQQVYHDKAMELFRERGLRLDAHEKLYKGLHGLFSAHRELPFHFLDRSK